MNYILSSLGKTVLSGFVLVLLLVFLASSGLALDPITILFFWWLHVLSGIMIGLLWY